MGIERHLSDYEFTPYSGGLILAALVGLAVAFVVWRRRTAVGAVYLALLELAVAEWAFAAAFEAAATTVSLKVLWSEIEYPGIASAPLFFFLFAMAYGQRARYLTRRNIALLSIVPVLVVGIVATNNWHHRYWTGVTINADTSIAIYSHGPLFWVFVGYSYSLLSIGVISLYLAILRFPRFYRSQIGALLVGSVLPILGNLLYVSGLNPIPGLDWTPIAFVLTGLVLSWGMFRFRILDLIPVARNLLVDTMSDGILVIDAQGRIVDLNPATQSIIGLFTNQAIGQSASGVLAHWKELIPTFQVGTETQVEVRVGEEEAAHCYDVRLSPLRDRHGQLTGQLVVLRDITIRRRLEEERAALIHELQDALVNVKTLSGLLPICAHCKKIRDDQGYWHSVEGYMREHSDVTFSHGLCPDCARQFYPEYFDAKE